MIVTVSGASGLTNAYRSVLSICGSAAVSGGSRWLEAKLGITPETRINTPTTGATMIVRMRFMCPLLWETRPPPGRLRASRARALIGTRGRALGLNSMQGAERFARAGRNQYAGTEKIVEWCAAGEVRPGTAGRSRYSGWTSALARWVSGTGGTARLRVRTP